MKGHEVNMSAGNEIRETIEKHLAENKKCAQNVYHKAEGKDTIICVCSKHGVIGTVRNCEVYINFFIRGTH